MVKDMMAIGEMTKDMVKVSNIGLMVTIMMVVG